MSTSQIEEIVETFETLPTPERIETVAKLIMSLRFAEWPESIPITIELSGLIADIEKLKTHLEAFAASEKVELRPLRASELIRLPTEERERIVAEAFARASTEDFEIFEAYSEEDMDDANEHPAG